MAKLHAITSHLARRRAARYAVPVAIVAMAAGGIGLAPAFAGDRAPDLPEVTAEELVARIAAADAPQLTGTVKVTADLGLPALPGLPGGAGDRQGAVGGAERGGRGADGGGDTARRPSADPQRRLLQLASGTHVLRVAVDGPERQRLSVLEDAAEYSVVRNGRDVWAYDSATHRVHHATLPPRRSAGRPSGDAAELTPQQLAARALDAVDDSTAVTVDGTGRVAGRDAYHLVLRPKGPENAESTVGSVRIAVDAERGVPLRFTLRPADGGAAVVDARYTEVDFARPDADTFAFTPPKGAEVTEAEPADRRGAGLLPALSPEVLGEDWHQVARLTLPGGLPLPDAGARGGAEHAAPGLSALLDEVTTEVKGEFGTGRVLTTRLVNVLLTEDGQVYLGALTPEGLVEAAEAAPAPAGDRRGAADDTEDTEDR